MQVNDTVRTILAQKGKWICCVAPETSVYDALRLMADHDIGAVVVESGAKLLGVFSERDYARKVMLLGKASRDTSVGEIMSTPPITVDPDRTVDDCMHIMTDRRIRHLPVVDGEVIAGMISIGDLVNWTIARHREEIKQLNHYIAGSYPS